MDDTVRSRIQGLIDQSSVVLFMKGTPQAPRCGFSAQVAGILDDLAPGYASVDVLADAVLREAIKEFSDWPTIPQLYIKGQFVGGCDIVKEMYAAGELEQQLGIQAAGEVAPPTVTITAAAARALAGAVQGSDDHIRFEVSPRFEHGLSVGPRQPKDVEVVSSGVTLLLDRGTAKRADGTTIDYVETPTGAAFKIDNPNEPPSVRPMSVAELAARRHAEQGLLLLDVRSPREQAIASIEGARLLDPALQSELLALPKDTTLVFHCHHGGRSQQAAEFFVSQGFRKVYNVTGGIDAWSREVDSSVPRY